MADENQDDAPLPGLICYRDNTRPCGPDCMAFLPQKPEGAVYAGPEQWPHCRVLVDQERLARHTTVIAGILSKKSAEAVRQQKVSGI